MDADDLRAVLRGEKAARVEWRDPAPMTPEARVVHEAEMAVLVATLRL